MLNIWLIQFILRANLSSIDINKIIETWTKISNEINSPETYSRYIFTDCKTIIRASINKKEKIKSVDFIFDKKIVDQKKINFKETKGIKVSIDYEESYQDKAILCIHLKNTSFIETYLKLLEKIISAIYEIENQEYSIHKLSTEITNWRKCFEDENYEGLTKEEQIGLYGELSVINEIYSKNVSPENILRYWFGPDRGLHDFKFPNFFLEVKTYSKKQNKIKISNIDQLNYKSYSNLHLGCVEIQIDDSGISLVELISSLQEKIFKEASLYDKFTEKLNAYGYFDLHKENYNNKFLMNGINFFKVEKNFPSILKEDVLEGIIDISYSIELNSCTEFKCNNKFIC